MDIKLLTNSMLGHWESHSDISQCEFQFDACLIYVQHLSHEKPVVRLNALQKQAQCAWDEIPQALKFAEQRLKKHAPELMRLCEAHAALKAPLTVYAISFEIDKPYPSYDIGKNHDFDWDDALIKEDVFLREAGAFKAQYEKWDDFQVCVSRTGFQQFEWDD